MIDTKGILSKKAMIVRLSTGGWSARKKDKEATEEVIRSNNAEKGAASVTKAMIDSETLKPIRDITRKMKEYHDTITLPWDNNGGRLLPITKHAEYTAFFRKTNQEFEDAVLDFINEYRNHITNANQFLGGLYADEDYPGEAEIKDKFKMEVNFEKVPEAADFRVDIPEYEQKAIAKQIEDRVEKQHAEAMQKVWKRVYNTIEKVYEKLENEDAIFRNTLISNVQDLVDILPELNILDDKNLADMTDELQNTICSQDPDALRKDVTKRQEVAKESRQLLDRIGAFFNSEENDNETEDQAA